MPPDERELVMIDATDAVAYVFIRPGPGKTGVRIEAGPANPQELPRPAWDTGAPAPPPPWWMQMQHPNPDHYRHDSAAFAYNLGMADADSYGGDPMDGRIVVESPAGPDERYAPGAFDRSVGKVIPVNLPDGTTTHGRVLAAEVIDGGRAVRITLEHTDDGGEVEGVASWPAPSVEDDWSEVDDAAYRPLPERWRHS